MFQMVGLSYSLWKGIICCSNRKSNIKKHLLTFLLSIALQSNGAYKYQSLEDKFCTNSYFLSHLNVYFQ